MNSDNKGWKKVRLGEVCNISSSKRIFAHEYVDSGIPFFRGKEIIEKQKGNNITNELFISEERYNTIKQKVGVPNKGDILLTSVGTLGIPWIVNIDTFYFKDGNLTWFKQFRNISNNFLYYWFLSPYGTTEINKKSIGSTQKALTIDSLRGFELSLPPLPTQQKIASILGSLDDKIELNNRINKNLEEQAQALFKRWFVDNKESFTYTKVGDVINTTSGGTPSRTNLSYYENGVISWVKSKELQGSYIIETEENITAKALKESSAKLIPTNSILIAMYGATVGEFGIIAKEMACNQAICALIPNDEYPTSFLFMFIKNKKEELKNFAIGSAQQNISQVLIRNLQIPCCSELITLYDNIVKPYFEQIRTNQQESLTLAQLRDSLLPKLMSNQIKL